MIRGSLGSFWAKNGTWRAREVLKKLPGGRSFILTEYEPMVSHGGAFITLFTYLGYDLRVQNTWFQQIIPAKHPNSWFVWIHYESTVDPLGIQYESIMNPLWIHCESTMNPFMCPLWIHLWIHYESIHESIMNPSMNPLWIHLWIHYESTMNPLWIHYESTMHPLWIHVCIHLESFMNPCMNPLRIQSFNLGWIWVESDVNSRKTNSSDENLGFSHHEFIQQDLAGRIHRATNSSS